MKYILLLIVILSIVSPTLSFWSTGHMIISKIAMDEIQKKDPAMLKKIQSEIDILTQYSNEDKHSFVESAVWADDNKGIAWGAFNEWHFVDTPVIAPDFHGEVEYNNVNATWAIYQMEKTLKNKNKPKFDAGLARSFAWRYLIHLVGDIHQPLHASSYYSKEFPNGDRGRKFRMYPFLKIEFYNKIKNRIGTVKPPKIQKAICINIHNRMRGLKLKSCMCDRGGNEFKVNYPKDKQIKNLHALWDACVDQYGSLWAPLGDKEWNALTQIVKGITEAYPRSKYQDRVKVLDERKWAQESNEISKKFVYDGIKSGDTPSQQYIDRGRQVVNEQLAVAGYRLADVMMSMYVPKNEAPVEEILTSD